MPVEVRSYALALWLSAKGHIPVDAGFTPAGTLVFTFSSSAATDVNAFHESKRDPDDVLRCRAPGRRNLGPRGPCSPEA